MKRKKITDVNAGVPRNTPAERNMSPSISSVDGGLKIKKAFASKGLLRS
jgi:hypothetical protein